jgi:penicillin amidase
MRKALLVLVLSFVSIPVFAQAGWVRHPGMRLPGQITRDANGVPHVRAFTDYDVAFLNGWVHAQDRLFQMDENRRQASGTLAELLGSSVLGQDVQLRAIGLRRGALLTQLELSPRAAELLSAYAAGVNAWVAANPLPPEYAAVEITRFEPWTPLDSISVAKLIAFGLNFDLDTDRTVALLTYQGAGQVLGVNGAALFFEDLFRARGFDPAASVPDASASAVKGGVTSLSAAQEHFSKQLEEGVKSLDPNAVALAKKWSDELREMPLFQKLLDPEQRGASNLWGISASLSATGNALIANDPHLSLRMPSTFYPIALTGQRINAAGIGFAGLPFVIQGHNDRIAWGTTNSPLDVTDIYQEQIVPDATSSAGLGSLYKGAKEPLTAIPESFRVNNPANSTPDDLSPAPSTLVPPATLIVGRRNAPIVSFDQATGAAVSLQWIGHGPTREIETFLIWNEARNLDDFKRGLDYFDQASQNVIYTDVDNNVAYFVSGEVPIREDLQAGTVSGLPPFFLRNGSAGGNDWIRVTSRAPTQSASYQIIPAAEMPQVVNPSRGWVVNANNDPDGVTLDNNVLNQLRSGGTGLYYLGPGFANGIRAGRITELIKEQIAKNQKFTAADMQRIQADVVMNDAKYFVPFLTRALDNAGASSVPALQALGANPAIAAAVNRLRAWDFTTPTGIPEGYDAADVNGALSAPSSAEVQSSVAATLYSVWRGQLIKNTIDAVLGAGNLPRPPSDRYVVALRNLLENYDTRGGAGVSGVQFFNVPGIPNNATTAPTRRDILMLASMADALALLAGDAFAPAFNKSTNQDDYRWGKLHRIVFRHPLGGPYNVPPAGGAFPAPLAGLDGIPVDGGYEVVDASSHNPRANTLNGFMFGSGPVRRSVSEATRAKINAVTSLPGGASGVLGNPLYINLLKPWLTNEAFPLEVGQRILLPWGTR